MTNEELYEIVKEGNPDKVKIIMPLHHVATGGKFILNEYKSNHAIKFDPANNTADLVAWERNNYKLSGKYSDDLINILLPYEPNILIEIKNGRIYKALWLASVGLHIDITHNIYFIKNVPMCKFAFKSGYLYGAIVSNISHDELYGLVTSPFPDEQILNCSFIVSYGVVDYEICETMSDLFEALTSSGFVCAAYLKTTIPKWSRTIESSKLWAGGTLGYKCENVLTAHNSMKMVNMLSTHKLNRWGVFTFISPSTLFEVVNITWDTIVDTRVIIFPVIAFKFAGAISGKFDSDIVIDEENNLLFKKLLNFKKSDIARYCIGDMFFGGVDSKGDFVLSKKFGSSVVPRVTPTCPKCNNAIDVIDDILYCINNKCPAVTMSNIRSWIDAFCPGINPVIIADFLHKYEITDLGGLYITADTNDMSNYQQILNAVKKSREVPHEFLNIILPFLTLKECDSIMTNFWLSSTELHYAVSRIFTSKNLESMDIGEDNISRLLEYMERNSLFFICVIGAYLQHVSMHPLYKKTFFVDGLLYEKDRIKYETILNKYGGRVVSNFGPFINGCIYGKYISSEMLNVVKQLAAHKSIAIYSEEEFDQHEKENWRKV
jgi:hypothetical protein